MRLLFALACTSAIAFAACAEDSTSPAGGSPEDAGADSSKPSPDADASASATTCETTRAFVIACGGELNCGPDKYDAWCAANDAVVNSEAFRRAEAKCLVAPASCEPDTRHDCEYTHYGTETPTAAQRALVDAYCATCEAGDVSGCKARATTYDPGAGPSSVKDIFIAAWELADPLCDAIREKCTGASFDGGADCANAFAGCSADEYLAKLPDCP